MDLFERSRLLIASCQARTDELKEQLELARQRLAASKKLLARSEAVWVPAYRGAAIPTATPLEPQAEPDGKHRTFAAVAELIEQIQDAATRDADLAGTLVEDIVSAIHVVAEPSLLMGILLEGMAETVLKRLPVEERRETAIAMCTLLWERIHQGEPEQH